MHKLKTVQEWIYLIKRCRVANAATLVKGKCKITAPVRQPLIKMHNYIDICTYDCWTLYTILMFAPMTVEHCILYWCLHLWLLNSVYYIDVCTYDCWTLYTILMFAPMTVEYCSLEFHSGQKMFTSTVQGMVKIRNHVL